ncbi:hypothetical protein [Leptospira ilyithenensis]|uniref:AttH domain-containing protein n=1 Tax=Leptospira ilyithenensis TaxID=2484901 RepID=A0A4R9LSH6_9LEPT|nr:hypothetical protein [Leptospira ilyithenensis]TGN14321.1 hypothetical protein EHS11_02260 [Leptospira ilyithenensis]
MICWRLEADGTNLVRLGNPSDFRTQIYSEEGYLQAWNFSLQNGSYKLFATFLVSNFGPGTKNNGISVIIKHDNEPLYYSTKEFGQDEFEMKKGGFFQQSGENRMDYKDGKYSIHMVFPEWTIDLDFFPNQRTGIAISGGKLNLTEDGRFVQADIPLSFVKVKGTIIHDGNVETVEGTGGMEHLLTNYEVHKYSNKWEIVRAITDNGTRIFTGGFIGNEKIPGGFFRKIAVLSKKGDLILEGTVSRSEILNEETESVSGYTLPKKERLYFGESDSCYMDVIRTKNIASMSALENISTLLRFFIQLFFAKPYQIHSETELEVNCKSWSGKGKGMHSYYLINK